MTEILIADDHSVVRKGLRQIFSNEADLAVVGEASSAAEITSFLRSHSCHVIILDLHLPNKNGIEMIRDLHAEFPTIIILVFSMYPVDQFGVRALRNGAAGYLTKGAESDEIVKAVRHVAGGRKYISDSLAVVIEKELHHSSERPLHRVLSDREFEICCAIAKGETNKMMAEKFNLSVKTVSNYRARALAKMNMKSNAEICRYIIVHALTD